MEAVKYDMQSLFDWSPQVISIDY